MAKTKITDLNRILFEQLERLNDLTDKNGEALHPEEVRSEFHRAKAIASISDQILKSAQLQVDMTKVLATHGDGALKTLPSIGEDK